MMRIKLLYIYLYALYNIGLSRIISQVFIAYLGSIYLFSSFYVTSFCYTKLGFTLFAVQLEIGDQFQVLLNPGKDVVIDDKTVGFLICHSAQEARR